jgi:pilin isopeptide linkage protein/LPXTG-motif cell wall-anchored protein
MNAIQKIKGKGVLCVIMALAVMWIAFAPAAAYADGSIAFTVEQVFTTSSAQADSTFTYRLRPQEPGNPMPAGSTADGYTFTISGTNNAEIVITGFSRPGVFRYDLLQVIDTAKAKYTYDRQVYTIVVHVDASLGVKIIKINGEGAKTEHIRFENSYSSSPSNPFLMVDPPVRKTVSGNPSHNSTFYFKLVAQDPSQPMPAGSAGGVKTIQIVGSGKAEFGTWTYNKAGVYYYSIYEVNTGEAGYTYDTAVYTITDKVTVENGQFVLSRVVTNSANSQVTSCAFINNYSAGGYVVPPVGSIEQPVIPIEPLDPLDPNLNIDPDDPARGKWNGEPDMPKTGDDSNSDLYLALLAFGGVLAMGAAIYLIKGKKREEIGAYR